LPDGKSGPAADRGTWLHAYAKAYINNEPLPACPYDDCDEPMEKIRNEVDADRADGYIIEAEVKVQGACGTGTADYVAIHPFNNRGKVKDWKSGFGGITPAVDSWQLADYIVGASLKYPQIVEWVGYIVPLDKFTGTTVANYGADDIAFARVAITALLANVDSVTVEQFNYNENACRYCGRAGSCPAFEEAMKENQDTAVAVVSQTVGELATTELDQRSVEVKACMKALERYWKEIEREVGERIEKGEVFDSWKVEEKLGNREWMPDADMNKLGVSTVTTVSPAEAEKRMMNVLGMKKSEAKALVDSMTIRPSEAKLKFKEQKGGDNA
jgi:hypothetical protein